MLKQILIISTLLICLTQGANYAVLVAGSYGYGNYRHQSDVFHSYQILLGNGVPAENIIVMAYNDIADSKQNPFPGAVYNKPSGTLPGTNVYAGVQIDYEANDVTPQNFIAVLTGNTSAVKGGNGRVLQSGKNDNVFIYFSDHGSPGLIAFPHKYLYADQLQTTFNQMHTQNMYSQLTFYLETCESGSMFQNVLPNNMSIYAVSAANPTQSSWATYCPPQDLVNGKHIGSCLGDEFSVNWMENSQASDPSTWTLQQQYQEVQTATLESEVMQWGDLTFTSEPIGKFQGMGKNNNNKQFLAKITSYFQSTLDTDNVYNRVSMDSRDAQINYLLNQFSQNKGDDDLYLELIQELTISKKYQAVFDKFNDKYRISGIYFGTTNFVCYRTLMDKMISQCGKLNDQSTRQLKYLFQYCGMYSSWEKAVFDC